MKISTLDQMIPQRWNLLFRYYLPWCKTPDPFYFKCREFIDDLKKMEITTDFPLDKLPKLLFILENYSKNNIYLTEFSKKMIGTLDKIQIQDINFNLLKQSLSEYGLENNDKNPIINILFNKLSHPLLLSKQEEAHVKIIKKTKKFDVDSEFNILKNILKREPKKTIAFLQPFPIDQRRVLIDRIIIHFYHESRIEGTIFTKELKKENYSFQVLHCLLNSYESSEGVSINIMQFLAITSLLNRPIDVEEISKFLREPDSRQEYPIEFQEYLAENRIKALKDLIARDFIWKIPRAPTRSGGIHRKFYSFYTDNYLNLANPIEELDLIMKELPKLVYPINRDKIELIKRIFHLVYELLESPSIREMKNKRILAEQKERIDYEKLVTERRRLSKRMEMGRIN